MVGIFDEARIRGPAASVRIRPTPSKDLAAVTSHSSLGGRAPLPPAEAPLMPPGKYPEPLAVGLLQPAQIEAPGRRGESLVEGV